MRSDVVEANCRSKRRFPRSFSLLSPLISLYLGHGHLVGVRVIVLARVLNGVTVHDLLARGDRPEEEASWREKGFSLFFPSSVRFDRRTTRLDDMSFSPQTF